MKLSTFKFFQTGLILAAGLYAQPLNTLSKAEVAAGFVLLFNGSELDDNLIGIKSGWAVEDEAMVPTNGGDLCFSDIYKDFELRVDVRVGDAEQNSGIFTRSPVMQKDAWLVGAPEFAIQGDPHDCNYPCHSGDDYAQKYALEYPQITGEPYNPMVLFFNGPFVEFWIQGIKVNEYELWSDAWYGDKAVSTRWSNTADYGVESEGFICIQDHFNDKTTSTWFRNIKIRSFQADGIVPDPVIAFSDSSNLGATVNIEVGMTGAALYYTLDGADPDVNSILYAAPFQIPAGTEVRVIAMRSRFTQSGIVSKSIDDVPVRIPHSQPGSFLSKSGSQIHVLTDGAHRIQVISPRGEQAYTAAGTQGASYDLQTLEPGIYIIRLIMPTTAVDRRIFLLN